MVVSAVDHHGKISPNVAVSVENLSLTRREIYVFSRARDHDVLAHEGASRVSVAGCFHVCAFDTVPQVCISVQHQLVCFIHRLWRLLIVATTNEE